MFHSQCGNDTGDCHLISITDDVNVRVEMLLVVTIYILITQMMLMFGVYYMQL